MQHYKNIITLKKKIIEFVQTRFWFLNVNIPPIQSYRKNICMAEQKAARYISDHFLDKMEAAEFCMCYWEAWLCYHVPKLEGSFTTWCL